MNGREGSGQEARLRCQWARKLKPTLAWAGMLCEHPNQKKINSPPPRPPKLLVRSFYFPNYFEVRISGLA